MTTTQTQVDQSETNRVVANLLGSFPEDKHLQVADSVQEAIHMWVGIGCAP